MCCTQWHCASNSLFFSFNLVVIIIRHQSSPVVISHHLTRDRTCLLHEAQILFLDREGFLVVPRPASCFVTAKKKKLKKHCLTWCPRTAMSVAFRSSKRRRHLAKGLAIISCHLLKCQLFDKHHSYLGPMPPIVKKQVAWGKSTLLNLKDSCDCIRSFFAPHGQHTSQTHQVNSPSIFGQWNNRFPKFTVTLYTAQVSTYVFNILRLYFYTCTHHHLTVLPLELTLDLTSLLCYQDIL